MNAWFRIRSRLLAVLVAGFLAACDSNGGSSDGSEVAEDVVSGDDATAGEDGVADEDAAGDDGTAGDDGGSGVVSATIGPQGGSLAGVDGTCSIEVPYGAVDTDIVFTIETVTDPAPGALGTVCRFGPEATTFATPIVVTIRYDPTSLGTTAEDELAIGTWDPVAAEWAPENSSRVDDAADLIRCFTSHFSHKAVVGLADWMARRDITTLVRVPVLYVDAAAGSDANTGSSPGDALQSIFEAGERLSGETPFVMGTTACLYGAVTELRLAAGTYVPHPATPAEGDRLERPASVFSLRVVGSGPGTVYDGHLTIGRFVRLEDMTVQGLLTMNAHSHGLRLQLTKVEFESERDSAVLEDSVVEGGGADGTCITIAVRDYNDGAGGFDLVGCTVQNCRRGILVDGASCCLYAHATCSVNISNSTIRQNETGLSALSAEVGSLLQLRVRNTLVTGNGVGVHSDTGVFDDGNTFSCNTTVDFDCNGSSALTARNSAWDHVPPRTVADGGNDVDGELDTTGASLAAEPCGDLTIVPTVTGAEGVSITELFGSTQILVAGSVTGSGYGVYIHDFATGALDHQVFNPFTDASFWKADALQTIDGPWLVAVGTRGPFSSRYFAPSFGMTVLLDPVSNYTDGIVLADAGGPGADELVLVDHTYDAIERYVYDPASHAFQHDGTFPGVATPGASGSKVSIVADASGDRVVVLTDGVPGEIWYDDTSTPTPAARVGGAGNSPRRIRCDSAPTPSGPPAMCGVTSFDSDELRVLDWSDATALPTVASTTTVGDGPVGLDIASLATGFVVVTTGFHDDSARLDFLDPAGHLVSTTTLTLPACDGPGHAAFVGAPPTSVVVSCGLDGTYVVVPMP